MTAVFIKANGEEPTKEASYLASLAFSPHPPLDSFVSGDIPGMAHNAAPRGEGKWNACLRFFTIPIGWHDAELVAETRDMSTLSR